MLFDSKNIFGDQARQSGPQSSYRAQDEQLPGVDGVRSYRLGAEPRAWTVTGRLWASSMEKLGQLVDSYAGYVNGRVYDFRDSYGVDRPNCQLQAFDPIGPILYADVAGAVGYTVQVQARIRQLSRATKEPASDGPDGTPNPYI